MTELELQSEYVMDFFCRRADGLGFREIKNNGQSVRVLEREFAQGMEQPAQKKRIQWRRAKIAPGYYGYDSRED